MKNPEEEEIVTSISPRLEIAGKVVIVTGASSGIGEATAREFARSGALVVLAARRVQLLEKLAQEIRTAGGVALTVPTDLTDQVQITNLVQTTLVEFGRIDVLANIAGWGRYDWFEELSADDLHKQYEVNVIGLAELIRQVLPVMKEQRSGHILNMSSYASMIAVPLLTVYSSTKYAVEGLTDALRRELKPWGIRVSRIHPSGVKGTEFNKKAGEQGGVRYRSVPIGKVTRERVAREIVDLVENPRRAVYMSRIYDIPVFLNIFLPRIVDLFTSLWVRLKRRKELTVNEEVQNQPVRYGITLNVPQIIVLTFSAVLFVIYLRRKL
ncbi:MAG: SDR family oxidoreductase [Chloroflexi bacterium]|nr:MAG: SDR family oxidoreductase [Chloroflexota bacterium]